MSLAMSAGIPQSSRVPVTAFAYDTWAFDCAYGAGGMAGHLQLDVNLARKGPYMPSVGNITAG